MKFPDLALLIEERSIPVPGCGCWLWTGKRTSLGYGQIYIEGKSLYAHRMSVVAYRGEFIDRRVVAHKCDTPSCVNPSHLFVCTQADNIADCVKKHRTAAGERNGRRKLSKLNVEVIRASKERPTILSKKYGVTPYYITMIRKGERWK